MTRGILSVLLLLLLLSSSSSVLGDDEPPVSSTGSSTPDHSDFDTSSFSTAESSTSSSSSSTSTSSKTTTTSSAIDPAEVAAMKYLEMAVASINAVNSDVQDLLQQIEILENEQAQFLDSVKDVEKLVDAINQRQLHAIILKLTEIENYELDRRADLQQQQGETNSINNIMSSSGVNVTNNASDMINVTGYIPREELQNMFELTAILNESDVMMETWIRSVLQDEVQQTIDPLLFKNTTKIKIVEPEVVPLSNDENDTVFSEADFRQRCVSPEAAALQVQQAVVTFSQDGIGLLDHAHRAATIVHERTSDTYQLGRVVLEDKDNTLGFVWWSRFIPEDWEKLLPKGWKDWNAVMPAFLSHSFGARFKANVAPPEAILDGSTVPGACWPMRGSAGRVTMLLPYPVKVTAVSIDHASALLATNRQEQIKSAPKKVVVYGYPPCASSNKPSSCDGMGFDVKRKMLLKTLEYDAKKGGVQTFEIGPIIAVSKEGSCEASISSESSSSSCAAPPVIKDPMMGIEVRIQENWGNPEYTCLYRFRVHGDVAAVLP